MTSTQIRQSFLDFFKSKQHTIVPSSSLMPDSPNLLFTNAGMNQFVPIFLGQTKCPYTPGRAADTQKCIRAGGKHNDLDDVGLDTYHHTFFEMLGNWSFGDYFKREAIDWAWELVVTIWKFPPQRLYATVYNPDKTKNDPSEFDQEAWDFWAEKFRSVGLDPAIHIVNGNKKDNFWMMGETGPCGPCSELHVDLTPNGDTRGSLVNKGDARCIEIWNLVFIQFNANPDGTFSPLPAKHVDTGMGFERVTSIIQGTKNFSDFANAKISNYETDIFRPIFDELEKLSGKKYGSTLPGDEMGRTRVSRVVSGVAPETRPTNIPTTIESAVGSKYSKRNLPHFERPWAKYMVTFATINHLQLSPKARDLVLESLVFTDRQRRWQLFAACVMPDHVHVLFEPQIKEQDPDGKPIFWSLTELMHSVKSFTAHEINKVENTTGGVWEKESFDRMMRSDADLEEKFHYICRNPWDNGVVPVTEPYKWLWTPGAESGSARVPRAVSGVTPETSSSQTSPEKSVGTGFSAGRLEEHAGGVRSPVEEHAGRVCSPEQISLDIAFRVIADHIRTLSFAIADGIQPGNTDRNYVLRRILRRAVRYGRTLGFHEPFFYKLVDVLADTMGDVFHEIRAKKNFVREVIRGEETAFNQTLGNGLEYIESILKLRSHLLEGPKIISFQKLKENMEMLRKVDMPIVDEANAAFIDQSFIDVSLYYLYLPEELSAKDLKSDAEIAREIRYVIQSFSDSYFRKPQMKNGVPKSDYLQNLEKIVSAIEQLTPVSNIIPGGIAFKLYDTYGFPLDLTELMARERGLTVDKDGFEKLMEEQRARARAAQKKEVISLSQIETTAPTKFTGFEKLESPARVLEVVSVKDKTAVVLDTSPFYAEMGGQVGDTGEISGGGQLWRVVNTQKSGNTWLHFIEDGSARVPRAVSGVAPETSSSQTSSEENSDLTQARRDASPARETRALPIPGNVVTLSVDVNRRNAIQRHHTVTHLLHWALHEVASKEASQKGSFVGPDKLTFDFNSAPLTPQQIADIEKLVNEKIVENAPVTWLEVKHNHVKDRKDVMQFFGDKYGEWVRVVQIGGKATALDGYSMELCGGTHTRATGEIGLFRIVGESAIAAGVRRIEAVAGLEAYKRANDELHLIKNLAGKVNSPVHELDKKIESLLAHQKELEKQLKSAQQREAAGRAKDLLARADLEIGVPAIIANLGDAEGDMLQAVVDSLKSQFKGVVVLGGAANGNVSLVANVSAEFTAKIQAGKIIQTIAPIVGGKGGGKPDNARGGGKDAAKLDEALAKAKSLLG
jgi:alanyl-tRNA synthetase/REP element-mobilizing transposase RayT